ncbi:unnamed protein product [Peronospora belbahrii]|uniref:Uncharacterized protein n=1 Tax=Peronospora belbahrii TaxID=622444 RepID=A0AAU9L6R5_9STRA|nr:unnamed protein product [Peronospora belbahrii]
MKRRTPRGRSESSLSSLPSHAHTGKLQPKWNTYLTDETSYKLNQQQKLQRVLQHMSTAHFSVRSSAVLASRRRLATMRPHSSICRTHNDSVKSVSCSTNCKRLTGGADAGDVQTVRRRRFKDVSSDRKQSTSRRREIRISAVSVQEEKDLERRERKTMDFDQKTQLQEVEELERMLNELKTKTKRLDEQKVIEHVNTMATMKRKTQRTMKLNEHICLQGEVEEEKEYGRQEENEIVTSMDDRLKDVDDQDAQVNWEHTDHVGVEKRLENVCHKTLEMGLDLAHQMETLTKKFDLDRRQRVNHDSKIEMLAQEVRATQAKYKCLETKYQDIVSQVDSMREAVIATEEAMYKMTLAFECFKHPRDKAVDPSSSSQSESS